MVCCFLLICCCPCLGAEFRWQEGDIIFQESDTEQGRALLLATGSRFSHVGIVLRLNGRLQVLEAVQPVRISSLNAFISQGTGGRYAVRRLPRHGTVLTTAVLNRMRRLGNSWLGRNYDPWFGWDDRRLYCSELVWKLFRRCAGIRLSALRKMGDFDLSHPLVRRILKRRYGSRVPLQQSVVAPGDLFASNRLITVRPYR